MPIAQLNRAIGCGPVGRGFESLWAYHFPSLICVKSVVLYYNAPLLFKAENMFLYHYIRHPKTTGAITQSSKKLSRIITENIDLENANNIIELGPGMGAFTKMILQKKKDSAKFFAVEINPNIANKLSLKFPNLDIAIGSANHLIDMMKERDMESADVIISGIPWSFLSLKEQSIMLKSVHNSLKDGGYFNTFAYHSPLGSAKVFKKKLYRVFPQVSISKSILLNIPPAFVYTCKK